ncbi:MAG: hypothetical protein ACK4IT_03765 [Thioalkalivibrionaceae bacterium]
MAVSRFAAFAVGSVVIRVVVRTVARIGRRGRQPGGSGAGRIFSDRRWACIQVVHGVRAPAPCDSHSPLATADQHRDGDRAASGRNRSREVLILLRGGEYL